MVQSFLRIVTPLLGIMYVRGALYTQLLSLWAGYKRNLYFVLKQKASKGQNNLNVTVSLTIEVCCT